jgi:N-acylglucosamine-6-phosphate 2-epimerase
MSKKMKNEILEKIKGGLIVSCQARLGWPMYGSEIMAAFAMAAQIGGAVAIRATGKNDIVAIKKKTNLPIVGINKQFSDYPVYITPTYESAKEILDVGIDVIALDTTDRKRPNNEKYKDIIKKIRANYPNVLIMGEISTIDEAIETLKHGVDLISTTLAGYTEQSKEIKSIDLDLIREIKKISEVPIIAEGMIKTVEDALNALKAGAYSVVVGTSITRPEIITKRFVEKIKEF